MESIKKPKIAYAAFFISFVLVALLHFLINPSVRFDDENEEIVIRYLDNITEAQSNMIEQFNNEYKGKIKVELINFPLDKFSSHERKQLLTKYLRNKSDKIDVFSVDQVWIPRFSNWSEPIDKYLTESEKSEIEYFAYNSCVYGDSLIAIPLFIDVGLMYVQTELLRKHPQFEEIKNQLKKSITWEDFIKLGQSEYFIKNPFYIFSADNYEGLMCSFTELLSTENDLFSANNSLLQPDVINATQFLVDIIQKYKISPIDVTNLQENNFGFYFYQNNAVFLRAWPNSFSSFFPINIEKRKDNGLLSVPLPHFKEGEKRFIRGGWNLMISKFSKKKEAAVEFLKFWLRKDVQAYMYENNGFLPSLKVFYEDEELLKKYDMISYYKELLNHSVFRPKNKNYTLLSDILTGYLKLALKNEISVESALKKAQDEINAIQMDMYR